MSDRYAAKCREAGSYKAATAALKEQRADLRAEIERLRLILEDIAERAERPTYNHLDVGFRHSPLTQKEVEERLRRTCEEIAQDARHALSQSAI